MPYTFLTPARTVLGEGALETAESTPDAQAAQQRIQGLDAPAQARLLAALRFWQQAPALQDSWQARRQEAAAAPAPARPPPPLPPSPPHPARRAHPHLPRCQRRHRWRG